MECATVPAPSSSPPPPLWDWDGAAATATADGGGKRARQQQQRGEAGSARCQVEVCGVELRGAKGYYRRHRVCEAHTKCPRVVVAGHDRRFCQQCSRFHALPEFDQNKRSCRRRLSDHNARRRKPQPDVFSFGSATLPPSLCDEERQISFMWEKGPLRNAHAKSISYSSCPSDSQLSQVMDIRERSPKTAADSGSIHLSKSSLSYAFPTLSDNIDELLPMKGADASGAASKLAGALDVRRALSLLSASSWGLADPVHQTSSLIQFTNSSKNPVSYSGTMDGQPLALEPQVVQFTVDTGSTVFPDLERIKPAYDSTLFSMNQIH